MIAYNNRNWMAVYQNLKKAQMGCGMITRVLEKTGATVWDRGMMYKSVDQSVLLYRSDSWVMTGAMIKVMEGFHHRTARQITGITETSGAVKEWEYLSVVAELKAAVLQPIMEYIRRQQVPILEKVGCRPIYILCVN